LDERRADRRPGFAETQRSHVSRRIARARSSSAASACCEVKDSGWGRFGGQAAMEEFTELRWITVRGGSHPYPF
jgi:acyl-CoA reductase-like NAD-dependent aldehyde dehydrogenase